MLPAALLVATTPVSAQSATPARVPSPAEAAAAGATPYRGAPLHWRPEWSRFETGNYVLMFGSLGLVVSKFVVGPRGAKQRGPVLLDEEARDALRIDTSRGRRFARDVSDVLLTMMESYPFFDAFVIAGWYRQSDDVAAELALINGETLAFTAALQAIANVAASRERPFGSLCGTEEPADGRDCDSNDRYFSFFSGHSSQSFASAGLICMHHLHLPLYGGTGADAAVCGGALAVATSVAALRVIGDQHYLSDVGVGALVGLLTGFGVPWVLHYHDGPAKPDGDDTGGLRLQFLPAPNGAAVVGTFP